jgi:hypothetical protein
MTQYPLNRLKIIIQLILILIPTLCYSQSQMLNGINLNGPKGFVKTDDLTWRNGNDIISIFCVKQDKNEFSKEYFNQTCKNGTRTTEFLSLEEYELNGKEYQICYQVGENKMVIGQVPVFKGEYTYIINVGTNMLDYKSNQLTQSLSQVQFNIGYMVSRILTY